MAISDKLQDLIDIKQDIKSAIVDKGVAMDDVPFTDYATKVLEISGGGSTPSTGSQSIFTGATVPLTYKDNIVEYEINYEYKSATHDITIAGLDGRATIIGNGTKDVRVEFDVSSATSLLVPFNINCENDTETLTYNGLYAHYGTELTSGQILVLACINTPRDGVPILDVNYKFIVSTTLPYFSSETTLWNGIYPIMILNLLLGKTTETIIISNFMQSCSAFNQPLTIPSGVTSIGDYFMNQCSAFNQPLTIPDSVTSIGTNFMRYCRAFNQPLTIPDSVTSIGNFFMISCYAFNQPLTIPSGVTSIGSDFIQSCSAFNQPLTIPDSLISIGNFFMRACYSFNQPLTIPDSVTSIGNYFMLECYAFNQPLTIPDSVTSIGTNFMYNCYALSILIFNSSIYPTDNNSLSISSNIKTSSTFGVKVYGTNRAGLMSALPNRTSNPFRYLLDGGSV